MDDVLIYDAIRTPRGKARSDGGLARFSPQELVAQQLAALTRRCGDLAQHPDGLTLGCVGQADAQGGHIALISKFHAGLPDRCHAATINNFCASGLSAIGMAASAVAAGLDEVAIAGGVEMMSKVPFMGDRAVFYHDATMPPHTRYIPVVLAADRLANREGVSRAELDATALASQQKAAQAESSAILQRSRIPVGDLDFEQCIRPATDQAGLAAQPAAFGELQKEWADALGGDQFEPRLTLSHAPPVCDGAGLALVGKPGLGPAPRARIVAFAERGGDPVASLTAGFAAMAAVLERAGLTFDQIDRIEFMEAFAVAIALFLRNCPVDPERVNVGGGHLAKGHPLGASGAILLSTLLDSLDACSGRYGLVVVSGAMGVGAAMIVERLDG